MSGRPWTYFSLVLIADSSSAYLFGIAIGDADRCLIAFDQERVVVRITPGPVFNLSEVIHVLRIPCVRHL